MFSVNELERCDKYILGGFEQPWRGSRSHSRRGCTGRLKRRHDEEGLLHLGFINRKGVQ